MMGRGDVEPLQFRRRHTFDLRVRTRPEHQHAAAYVICHLRDKQHGIGILDQRAKAFRVKFRGNIVREIQGIGAGRTAQRENRRGKSRERFRVITHRTANANAGLGHS
jgi:hypothetical protein